VLSEVTFPEGRRSVTTPRVIASTLIAIGLAGLVAGCTSSNDGGEPRGSLAIKMTATGGRVAGAVQPANVDHDDAVSHLKAAVVTIAGLEARLADGTWVPVGSGLPVDVDVVAIMRAGTAAQLPADLIPEGDYAELQLRTTKVQLTLTDDTTLSMEPSGSGWTVRVPASFSVVAARSTIVKLNLRCGSSFSRFDGQFAFDPEIDVEGVEHD
jgi:hypothetical protein